MGIVSDVKHDVFGLGRGSSFAYPNLPRVPGFGSIGNAPARPFAGPGYAICPRSSTEFDLALCHHL